MHADFALGPLPFSVQAIHLRLQRRQLFFRLIAMGSRNERRPLRQNRPRDLIEIPPPRRDPAGDLGRQLRPRLGAQIVHRQPLIRHRNYRLAVHMRRRLWRHEHDAGPHHLAEAAEPEKPEAQREQRGPPAHPDAVTLEEPPGQADPAALLKFVFFRMPLHTARVRRGIRIVQLEHFRLKPENAPILDPSAPARPPFLFDPHGRLITPGQELRPQLVPVAQQNTEERIAPQPRVNHQQILLRLAPHFLRYLGFILTHKDAPGPKVTQLPKPLLPLHPNGFVAAFRAKVVDLIDHDQRALQINAFEVLPGTRPAAPPVVELTFRNRPQPIFDIDRQALHFRSHVLRDPVNLQGQIRPVVSPLIGQEIVAQIMHHQIRFAAARRRRHELSYWFVAHTYPIVGISLRMYFTVMNTARNVKYAIINVSTISTGTQVLTTEAIEMKAERFVRQVFGMYDVRPTNNGKQTENAKDSSQQKNSRTPSAMRSMSDSSRAPITPKIDATQPPPRSISIDPHGSSARHTPGDRTPNSRTTPNPSQRRPSSSAQARTLFPHTQQSENMTGLPHPWQSILDPFKKEPEFSHTVFSADRVFYDSGELTRRCDLVAILLDSVLPQGQPHLAHPPEPEEQGHHSAARGTNAVNRPAERR